MEADCYSRSTNKRLQGKLQASQSRLELEKIERSNIETELHKRVGAFQPWQHKFVYRQLQIQKTDFKMIQSY